MPLVFRLVGSLASCAPVRYGARWADDQFAVGLPVYYADSAQLFRSVLEKLLLEIRLRIIQLGELQNQIVQSSTLPKIPKPFE